MTENQNIAEEPINLDPSELLGLSQVAKVSGVVGKPDDLARLLSKIGAAPEGPIITIPPPLSLCRWGMRQVTCEPVR